MTMIMDTAAPGTARLDEMLAAELPAKWRAEMLAGFGEWKDDDATVDCSWLQSED